MSDEDFSKVTPELEAMVREQSGREIIRGDGFLAQSMQNDIRRIKAKQNKEENS